MYTEICHYLLFHLTLSAILWVLYCWGKSFVINYLNATLCLKKKTNSNSFFLSVMFEKISPKRFYSVISKKWSQKNDWAEDNIMSKILLSSFFLFLSLSFFGTINNYISSDFSVYNTTTNSTADIPLFYKISATWSNHEGSLLLWCWLLSFSAFLFFIWNLQSTKIEYFSRFDFYSLKKHVQIHLAKKKNYNSRKSITKPVYKFLNYSLFKKNKKLHSISEKMIHKLKQSFSLTKLFHSTDRILKESFSPGFCIVKRRAAFVTKIIIIFFITFCIITSNPFLHCFVPSMKSNAELNPILQDPILAIHPPCIYIGYVASGIAFSLCVSHFSETNDFRPILKK